MSFNFHRLAALAVGFLVSAGANAGIVATNSTYGIADGAALTRDLNVTTRGKITDLNITIAFAKCDDPPIGPTGGACLGAGDPFEEEFSMLLIAPNGVQVRLINPFDTYNGLAPRGAGRVSVSFDDEAPNQAGPRIQSGSFRPTGALSGFDGMDAFGIWKLEVRDFFAADPFEFFEAQLDMAVEAPAQVPEPATLAMLGLGLLGLRATRRR